MEFGLFRTIFFTFLFHNVTFLLLFFGGLECVGHSFAYVAHFVFLRDVLKNLFYAFNDKMYSV